jgi:crotonobetainyl-CoA:carnitine CoA-transferase CaiB-like acyl-CoA transferase
MISRLGGTEGKPAKLPALPIEFGADRARPGIRMQSPRMGQHTQAVLGEAGYAPDAIAALADAGVVILG